MEHRWAVHLKSPLEKSHQHPSRTGLDLDLEGSMALAGQTSSEEHLGKENPEYKGNGGGVMWYPACGC